MDTRVALIAIIVENPDSVERLNALLHDYAPYIIGRMGIPYRERGLSVISLIVDGEADQISALTGRLGRVRHVAVKTALTRELP